MILFFYSHDIKISVGLLSKMETFNASSVHAGEVLEYKL